MRLQEVKPSQMEKVWLASENPKVRGLAMQYQCVGCGCYVTYGERGGVFADLDGRPFKDYYCGKCAAEKEVECRRTTKITGA